MISCVHFKFLSSLISSFILVRMSISSSAGLSGIVGSDYVAAQQEIESVLVRNINGILSNKEKHVDRISEVAPLVQDLMDNINTLERKLRIANDKIVDLELSGVVGGPKSEISSTQILHAQLQRREAEMAQAVAEIETLTEQLDIMKTSEKLEHDRLVNLVALEQRKNEDITRREAKEKRELEIKLVDLKSQLSRKAPVSIQDKVELGVMQDEVARQRRKIAELETKVNQSKAETDLLKSRLKQTEQSDVFRTEKIRSLELENDELRDIIAQRDEIMKTVDIIKQEVDEAASVAGAIRSQLCIIEQLQTQVNRLKNEKVLIEKTVAFKAKRVMELEGLAFDQTATIKELKLKISSLEEDFTISCFSKESIESELKDVQNELSRNRPNHDDRVIDEIFASVKAVRDEVSKELALKSKQIETLATALREKDKMIESLQQQLMDHRMEEVIAAEAVLVDQLDDGLARREIEVACAELRSLIQSAGWPIDNKIKNGELGHLVSVIKTNIEGYAEQIREMSLDIEYLRSQLETERMGAEDSIRIMMIEIEKIKKSVMEESSKRRVLQESALELAEKTTVLWNKYRNNAVPPFSPFPNQKSS